MHAVARLAVVVMVLGACGGSSPTEPPPPSTPPPVASATPAATATPVGALACPYGKGRLDAQCETASPTYLDDVGRAIDETVRRRPELFDLKDEPTPGGYRVVHTADYFAAVVQQLQAAGFCAEGDGSQHVQVKKSYELSEKYAILTSGGYVRRGDRSYRDSCRPAIFPVDAADYIDAVRVHFYAIRCPDPIATPDNAERRLPVGCTGYVSATPKDRNNVDVPPHIHGPDITWEFRSDRENLVRVSDYPGQPFNKLVDALSEGDFTMCATVKGVSGCTVFHAVR